MFYILDTLLVTSVSIGSKVCLISLGFLAALRIRLVDTLNNFMIYVCVCEKEEQKKVGTFFFLTTKKKPEKASLTYMK